MERIEEITSVILKTISTHKNSLSIVDLAELTGIHRNVLAKYIKVLEAQGKIEISRVGAKKYVQLSHRVSVSFLKVFTNLPFFIFDRHLTVVDKNDEISELYNLEKINSDLSDSQDRLLKIFLTEEINQLLHNAVLGQRATKILETTGTKVPHSYSLTIIPVVFDNGRPGCTLIIEDSTKREEEKRKCDQIKTAYRELLDNQAQFIVRFNREYKIITTNSNFSQHTGIEDRFLIGSQFIPPYPEDNYHVVITQMSSISPDNPVVSLDLRRINKTGDFSWERWKIRGVYDNKSGKFLEYSAVGLDITELKRTEQEFVHLKNNLETIIQTRTIELREVNNELHKEMFRREIIERELALTKFAIDSAHDFIFLLNSEGDIQYMNVRAHEILAKPENLTLNIRSVMANDPKSGSSNPFTLSLNEMIDSGVLTIKGSIHSVLGKDFPVEITMSRIIEQGEPVFCCIARDITDRNKIEKDLFNYRKHLEEIIDERTKRLQNEIDTRKTIENKYQITKERLHLLSDNSHEAVFIYNDDTQSYQDLNYTAELLFLINRQDIKKSVPEQLSQVMLKNGQNLQQLLEERFIHFRNGGDDEIHKYIVISKPFFEREIAIQLKIINLDYHRYIRISITDVSILCSA